VPQDIKDIKVSVYIDNQDVHDAERLKELQSLSLSEKIAITQARIIEWFNFWEGNVFVSFSGGKDSTVLLDLVRKTIAAINPTFEVPVVFSNTGLEYPEIQAFARKQGATFVTPKMNFVKVIREYGYPLIGKEVANAIYYARRIRPYNNAAAGCSERERERERGFKETIFKRLDFEERRPANRQMLCSPPTQQFLTTDRKRAELSDKRYDSSSKSTYQAGEYKATCASWELGNDNCTAKSKFNKKKWLPLVYTPFLISGKCCDVMKKSPMGIYQRATHNKPFLGTMADESLMRRQSWIRTGCNAFEGKKPSSQPLSFWSEQDILNYIKTNNLEICSVYGDIVENGTWLETTGCKRTGCVFCAFGVYLEKGETRFQALARTHPKQYKFAIEGGEWIDNPYYDPNAPEYDGEWKNWNPKKLWTSNNHGLGMGYVFDMVNEIYGENFMRYKI